MAASVPLAIGLGSTSQANANAKTITRTAGKLSWLDGQNPKYKAGNTFGHPWSEGALQANTSVQLISQQGKNIPLQTWPTAYWPDGSVKWTAHASPADVDLGDRFYIKPGPTSAPKYPVSVIQRSSAISVNTRKIKVQIATNGSNIIKSISRGAKLIGKDAKLVGLVQKKPTDDFHAPEQIETFKSNINKVNIEQFGPVRAVIKIEGSHTTSLGREWLPFTLRLYFYANSDAIKISHNFIFDGNVETDFIRGLGLRFNVVQHDELYNRHIRFVGQDDGLWGEGVKGITGLRRDPGKAVRESQIAGIATPPLSEWDERVSSRMHWIPVWNDFTLSQINANGFTIKKRTKEGHAWIDADQGNRASGVAYLGGASGGVVFGMRDFWQLHPVQVDIRNAGAEIAEATIWFYSPEAPAMDLRFYHDGLGQETYEDQLDALNITYEDYEPGFGDAHGIARTTDFTLCIVDKTPSRQKTIEIANNIRQPEMVVAHPHDYLASGVFGGLWSLPKRETKAQKEIEDRLDWQISFYKNQIDQHHWYGFWNYGDIMHTYDKDRHVWRYDIGGYAWDNSELSPDLWLWYSFLRSGNPDAFHLAERMTRHTRDVDMYHAGRFKGLGTRHNVQHWGCSAKQMRISTAAYRRFHYYITGDERTGDVLTEVASADQALGALNATRKVDVTNPYPELAKMGGGTDWSATAANWLTAWERTGDLKYKQRLEKAMRVIGKHPQGFFAGAFGYNTKTRELVPYPDNGPTLSHLSSVFGLIEISTELNQLLDVPEYRDAWLRYGRLYSASREEQKSALGKAMKGNSLTVAHSRLTAYVANLEQDPKLAKRAWYEFTKEWQGPHSIGTQSVNGPDVLTPIEEAGWLSTNQAAQWGLAAIQNLSMIEAYLEE